MRLSPRRRWHPWHAQRVRNSTAARHGSRVICLLRATTMMQSPPATVPMTVPQFMLSLRQQVADAADLRMAIDVQTNRIALTLAVHDALNPPRS